MDVHQRRRITIQVREDPDMAFSPSKQSGGVTRPSRDGYVPVVRFAPAPARGEKRTTGTVQGQRASCFVRDTSGPEAAEARSHPKAEGSRSRTVTGQAWRARV